MMDQNKSLAQAGSTDEGSAREDVGGLTKDYVGRVADQDGAPIPGAMLRLTSDLVTLGADPRAVASARGEVTWTRPLTGFGGSLWNCWQKYVAHCVAGLSWEEFRRQAAEYNPSLRATDDVMVREHRYYLPENRRHMDASQAAPDIVWDRVLDDYDGDLWACWRRNVQGKVVGLTWEDFRRQVRSHNTGITAEMGNGGPHTIVLPRNTHQDSYARVTFADLDGRFRFEDVPPGMYHLEVTADGFLPDTREIQAPVEGKVVVGLQALLVVLPKGDDFVRTSGRDFAVNGRRFRFIGVNLRGLVHYGQQPGLPFANARDQLSAARNAGARVVRVFAPHKDVSPTDTANRMRNLLNLMQAEFPEMYLVVCLCNLYNDVDFRVPGDGDDAYDLQPGGQGAHILGHNWFREGYKEAYTNFARTVVTAFRDNPRILAYNVGNELKAQEAPDLLVNFMLAASAQIRAWDGGNHLITTGMISTRHAFMAGNDALRMRLYGSPNLDFITNHAYHGDQPDAPSIEDDSDLSVRLAKPLVIEEAGFMSRSDRTGLYDQDLRRLLDEKRASGFMPWGFMAGHDNGDGDQELGIDTMWHNADWDSLGNLFRNRAAALAADNGEISVPKPATKFTVGQTVFTQTDVNMRKAPGLNGPLLQQVAARTQVLITGDGQPRDGLLWWPVKVANLTGFIAQTNKANVALLGAA